MPTKTFSSLPSDILYSSCFLFSLLISAMVYLQWYWERFLLQPHPIVPVKLEQRKRSRKMLTSFLMTSCASSLYYHPSLLQCDFLPFVSTLDRSQPELQPLALPGSNPSSTLNDFLKLRIRTYSISFLSRSS